MGKWLRPVDYFSTEALLYATNRALAALGTELNINFAHIAWYKLFFTIYLTNRNLNYEIRCFYKLYT